LSEAGADAWVTEEPAPDLRSDVDLVFAADLEWHLSGGPIPSKRVVVLQPDRDQVFALAEKYNLPAVVFHVEFDAWTRARNNLIVRRELAAPLGGTLGPGAPYVMTSEQYAAWMDSENSPLVDRLVRFLAALPPAPIVVSADDARKRGLPGVTIRVEPTTGLIARPFPMKDLFMAMNGPPGGPLSVVVWNCADLPSEDVSVAIQTRFVPALAKDLELGKPERLYLMGADRTAMTFRTGEGSRTSWFGFRVNVRRWMSRS
jgi:hypothetical protein